MPTTGPITATDHRIDDLDRLPFDNRFTAALPADPETGNHVRQVRAAAYSRVTPTPVRNPAVLGWSPEVAELLGFDPAVAEAPDTALVFGGNRVPAGADPFAACYGGHQFGNWAGQLGDGRAIALGEVIDRDGGHQTLQLKGAGPTPYSRRADGRAVLRSSVREFLCSEAMHHLAIPTTRALSLVTTGDDVVRDVLYDGHPRPEPGAVVCRVAPSFTRFGTFELPAARGELDLLRALVAHTITTDFPHLVEGGSGRGAPARQQARHPLDPSVLGEWFAEVCDRTADVVVDWMRVGFVHGVLNTDNMSILGLTIDYGPYGWLEGFDPGWTPNTTDAATRRYCYGAQPQVAQWNLAQLGNTLITLTDDPAPFQAAVDGYGDRYHHRFLAMMAERLGWGSVRDGDEDLVGELFAHLQRTETDQVLFFRDLADVPIVPDGSATDDDLLAPLADAFYRPDEVVGDVRAALGGWLRTWGARVVAGGVDDHERHRRMDAVNPRYVLRNSLAVEAIEAAERGDATLVHTLLDVLRHPYDDQPGRERFADRRPEWARTRVGASMLSCSS